MKSSILTLSLALGFTLFGIAASAMPAYSPANDGGPNLVEPFDQTRFKLKCVDQQGFLPDFEFTALIYTSAPNIVRRAYMAGNDVGRCFSETDTHAAKYNVANWDGRFMDIFLFDLGGSECLLESNGIQPQLVARRFSPAPQALDVPRLVIGGAIYDCSPKP